MWPHITWLTVSLCYSRLWSMWWIWLVFCDCGFHSVHPLMEKDNRLMETSWWERLTGGKLDLVGGRFTSSDHMKSRFFSHLLREFQNYHSLLNNHRQKNVGSHQNKIPHVKGKEEAPERLRRSEIAFRIKRHTNQSPLEGSNQPCAHQDLKTPQRLIRNCVWVSLV